MRLEHLTILVCPNCKGNMEVANIRSGGVDRVEGGQLKCTACESVYDVVRSVPRFVPSQNYAAGFGFQWTKHSRTQYDSHSGANISEKRFFEETKWPRSMEGQIILEVGSGSGRFTEHAASTGATVVSVDYSYAVDANYASNGDKDNVLIVQADLYSLPFRQQYFDKLFCFGVLQHTPHVENAFMALPGFLRSGGQLVVDVYRKPRFYERLLFTKYLVRPLTRRTEPDTLYEHCAHYVNFMWPLARRISKFPGGRRINNMLLISDYGGLYRLSNDMLREWAILDTFDMLSPRYDNPQTIDDVREWFERACLLDIDVHYGYNGIEGRGTRL